MWVLLISPHHPLHVEGIQHHAEWSDGVQPKLEHGPVPGLVPVLALGLGLVPEPGLEPEPAAGLPGKIKTVTPDQLDPKKSS